MLCRVSCENGCVLEELSGYVVFSKALMSVSVYLLFSHYGGYGSCISFSSLFLFVYLSLRIIV